MIAILPMALLCLAPPDDRPALVEVRKIGDAAPHNAFTDLVRFRDAWFCAFREGTSHVSPDGALRVLTSADGRTWTPASRVASADADLRDPKLSVRPDGRLEMIGVSVRKTPGGPVYQSVAWTSADGRDWGPGTPIGEPGVWLWRLAWHEGAAYGVGYATGPRKFARLYRSPDGLAFDPIVPDLFDRGYPNEAALAFLPDGAALCLLRRDGADGGTAQLGRSRPPYGRWDWVDLGVKIGGPALLRLPDGRIVAGVRLHDGKTRTGLCWLDPGSNTLTEFLPLPSGGDSSYPGLAWHDGRLWVSYYSSHEGKASIYLAEVRLPPG